MICFKTGAKLVIISQIAKPRLQNLLKIFNFLADNAIFIVSLQSEMSILHIFNPEHDIALASNLANFTAPHAGRQLRNDLGFLPALWAGQGDVVLVENIEQAQKAWQRISARLKRLGIESKPMMTMRPEMPQKQSGVVTFCDKHSLVRQSLMGVLPWGWNKALRRELERKGVDMHCVPDEAEIDNIRLLSHRRTSARLLPQLRIAGTVGEATECRSEQEVSALYEQYGRMVLKAPWSSSGRGVRFVEPAHDDPMKTHNDERWLRNVLSQQGSIMVEPIYNKVKDFGMEFMANGVGDISYKGLSLFHTVNGAYVGNILATEPAKQEMISHYISIDLLEDIKQRIMSSDVLNGYQGPFGVDMMVVKREEGEWRREEGFLLHPCVEINLRRTMGHAALELSPDDDDLTAVMRIDYTDNYYKLRINRL